MFYDKRHSAEAQEWYFRMVNDPNQWEQFRYIDTINEYNMIIEECQEMYDEIPVTSRLKRATCLSTIKKAERDLAKTLTDYDKFKQYKASTAISR